MRILHLIGALREFHINLVSAVRGLGVDASIIAYSSSRHAQMIADVPFVFYVKAKLMWLRTPIFQILRAKATSKAIVSQIRQGVEIIHAHMLFTDGLVAYFISRKICVPFIVAVRNSDVNYATIWAIPWLKRMAVKVLVEADVVVFISPSYKEKLARRLGSEYSELLVSKSRVLPNAIDDFWFIATPFEERRALDASGSIVVLTVGDICKNKNQLAVAEYLSKLIISKGLKFEYIVVGDVKSKSYHEKLSSFDFVKIYEKCGKGDLLNYYRAAHLYAMISRHETFGLVYIEALSQGLPIIYTNNEGVDGYFAEMSVGVGVDPSLYSEFESAMFSVLTNYETMSSTALRESQRFSSKCVSIEYANLYNSIALKHGGSSGVYALPTQAVRTGC